MGWGKNRHVFRGLSSRFDEIHLPLIVFLLKMINIYQNLFKDAMFPKEIVSGYDATMEAGWKRRSRLKVLLEDACGTFVFTYLRRNVAFNYQTKEL